MRGIRLSTFRPARRRSRAGARRSAPATPNAPVGNHRDRAAGQGLPPVGIALTVRITTAVRTTGPRPWLDPGFGGDVVGDGPADGRSRSGFRLGTELMVRGKVPTFPNHPCAFLHLVSSHRAIWTRSNPAQRHHPRRSDRAPTNKRHHPRRSDRVPTNNRHHPLRPDPAPQQTPSSPPPRPRSDQQTPSSGRADHDPSNPIIPPRHQVRPSRSKCSAGIQRNYATLHSTFSIAH